MLGKTNGEPPLHKRSRWWNDDVANTIKSRKEAFKTWKKEGNYRSYLNTKKIAKNTFSTQNKRKKNFKVMKLSLQSLM